MKVKFEIQRFGGGGTTTVTSRDPTPDEERIIAQQADIAEQYAPNAVWLNTIAKQLLNNSVGAVQQDFNQLNKDAQQKIADSWEGLRGIMESNRASSVNANDSLSDLINQMYGVQNYANNGWQNLANSAQDREDLLFEVERDLINGRMDALTKNQSDIEKRNDADLDAYEKIYKMLAGDTSPLTAGANDNYNDIVDDNSLIGQYNKALTGTNDYLKGYQTSSLADLAEGKLPTKFENNMTDAIKTAMTNTIGATMNDLAQRGVLNSSITNQAINDIESNTADALAQHYLQNIGTVKGLVDDQATLAQQQYGNTVSNLDTQGDYWNNLYNAYNTYSQGKTALDQQNFANAITATGANDSSYNQLFNNAMNKIGTESGLYNSMFNAGNQALSNAANWANQRFSNTSAANAANANIYSQVGIGQAGAPMTTAAAAQEAAQSPALNLWNASIGLTGSNNGTLAALAGANQNATTTQSGGGLFSGLFGGLF